MPAKANSLIDGRFFPALRSYEGTLHLDSSTFK